MTRTRLVAAAALCCAFTILTVAGQGQAPGATAFTAEQAAAGRAAFEQSCAMCHGQNLRQLPNALLAGTEFVGRWGSRATSDLVPVPVSVRRGTEFVSGLAAGDFELYDNGVRQEVATVSPATLGIDVSLVVDTSGSVIGSLARFKSDVKEIAGTLRPLKEKVWAEEGTVGRAA